MHRNQEIRQKFIDFEISYTILAHVRPLGIKHLKQVDVLPSENQVLVYKLFYEMKNYYS